MQMLQQPEQMNTVVSNNVESFAIARKVFQVLHKMKHGSAESVYPDMLKYETII